MPDPRVYTSLHDALAILSRALKTRGRREVVGLSEAFGRVLAVDVVAREDYPAWDVSHFDGYAVASAGAATTDDPPTVFRVVGAATPLGMRPKRLLRRGEAMKILTGGYLPSGADAVVPKEDVLERAGEIRVARAVMEGEQVYRAGADVRKGEKILAKGRTLMGQDLVLLATFRCNTVEVFARPRVGVLPTGTELTSDPADRRAGKVLETHSLLLSRLVEGAGGVADILPIVPDRLSALSRALRAALGRHEIVFTLAGSSIGEPDLVDSSLRSFGRQTTAMVHGVKVNRGRVMGFAVTRGKPVVILPGPIQGALNAFIVFGYPLIRWHLGKGLAPPPSVPAVMNEGWEPMGRFKTFDQVVYLHLSKDGSSYRGLAATASSGETEKISFLVSRNAYALVSGSNPRLVKGQKVEAHLLPGFSVLE